MKERERREIEGKRETGRDGEIRDNEREKQHI